MSQARLALRALTHTAVTLGILSLWSTWHFYFLAFPLWRREHRPTPIPPGPNDGLYWTLRQNFRIAIERLYRMDHESAEACLYLSLGALAVAVVLFFLSRRLRSK